MSSDSQVSLFTRIIDREIPARIVFEDEQFIVFHDIAPQAPVHLLIVPKVPDFRNVVELAAADPTLMADLVATAKAMADLHTDGQFRLVFNTGEAAGQTVFHVHAHLLGGGLAEGTL